MHVFCSANSAPNTTADAWAHRWEGPDEGLIAAWLAGRALATTRPDLVEATLANELPELPFKGGVRHTLKNGKKFGPLLYLAMWHGLRGNALDLDTTQTYRLSCARTSVTVTFTPDSTKWANLE